MKSYVVPNQSPDIQRLMEALEVAWEALVEHADGEYHSDRGGIGNAADQAMSRIRDLTGRTWEEK